MVKEQPSLFGEVEPTTAPHACAPCGEPAKWMPVAQRWGTYCGGRECINTYRLCKRCRRRYHRDEGGTRYCSPECRETWHRVQNKTRKQVGECANCGNARTGFNTWDLCVACWARVQPVARPLQQHHVPIEKIRRLLTDGTCFNSGCDEELLTKRRNDLSGRWKATLQVDHDHRHCPGPFSCGLCVRGLLCSGCNATLGMINDDVERLSGLVEYLK